MESTFGWQSDIRFSFNSISLGDLLSGERLHNSQYCSMVCPELVGESSLRRTRGYTELNQNNHPNVQGFPRRDSIRNNRICLIALSRYLLSLGVV